MSRMLAQGEVFLPVFPRPGAWVTAAECAIIRLSDGLWLDWNDGTFKDSAWTPQWQAMTLDTDGVFVYTTGWTVPAAHADYRAMYRDQDGGVFEGETVQVSLTVTGAVNDGAPSATTFVTDLPAGTDDHYKDSFLLFTAGALAGQVRKVTAYNGTTKAVTCAAFTGAPGNGDAFRIINN